MLDGRWTVIGGKLGQSSLPLPAATLVITGDRYVVESGADRDEGRLVRGGTPALPTLDLIGTGGAHRGVTIAAIMRLRGDLMQLCYAVDGSGRPRSFDAPAGVSVVTVRYRRQSTP